MSGKLLGKLLNFTEQNLAANRAGYMTEKQRRSRDLFLIRLFLPAIMGLIPIWLLVDLYGFGTDNSLRSNELGQYYIGIADLKFPLDQDIFQAFADNEHYEPVWYM